MQARRLPDIPPPHYQWPYVDSGLDDAVRRQLRRSLFDRDATGVIGEYERAFARFIGMPYAVSFSSGTAAIHAMSRIIGLKPGDAVLAPAYTFLATASPFAYEGTEVIFADADEYGNVFADDLAARLRPNVRAIIVTHMWGNPCAMDEIVAFCRAHGLILLEDASHAHFASWRGGRAGTFGDVAAFSTGQKPISTGEGGVLVTRDDRYRQLAVLFGHYNWRPRAEIDPAAACYPFAFTGMGIKYRLTALGAAIGLHPLARAGEIERRRRAVLARFRAALDGNPVVSPIVVPEHLGCPGLYVVAMRFRPENATVSRDEFVARCHAEGAIAITASATRDLSGEPLFARRDRDAPWRSDSAVPRRPAHLPGVARFQETFLMAPLWGYERDDELVEGYLAALTAVSAAVAR